MNVAASVEGGNQMGLREEKPYLLDVLGHPARTLGVLEWKGIVDYISVLCLQSMSEPE